MPFEPYGEPNKKIHISDLFCYLASEKDPQHFIKIVQKKRVNSNY